MKVAETAEIRESFLDFFERHEHRRFHSSPLIPANDPTLFFTNAGMVPFKDIFTGQQERPCPRATSVQKCLRVSGKHNDLENVGRTPRHHTFFEMLGNFSFGDYFKREAIALAWSWLTESLGIPADRLWITIHHSDDEAFELWHRRVGVPADRIQRMGDADNFWAMGDVGPCGPCSEIHFDHGPSIDPRGGGPAGESPRYVEIWNLVFMQYERDASGDLHPLPHPSIDTGAGLERIAAVLQGAWSNYDTDGFRPLLALASDLAHAPYGRDPKTDVALRVVADHARAAAFLVADGIMPANEGRSYVLRRILRRAVRYGFTLGLRDPFLWKVADGVVQQMSPAYPELASRRAFIEEVIRSEEERFAQTLDKGLAILDRAIDEKGGGTGVVLDGELVFRLYDTYGFPVDLTRLVAGERGARIDEEGYHRAMEHQRELGRAAWKGSGDQSISGGYHDLARECPTGFTGYDRDTDRARIHALIAGGERVETLSAGQRGEIVLPHTPFYGEAGGQVGDTGTIERPAGGSDGGARLRVLDTRIPVPDLFVHEVEVEEGSVSVGDEVILTVDAPRRNHTRLNHTATHLLHAALKRVLGSHVAQKGSLVSPRRLRFDFAHHKPVEPEQLEAVEQLVQERILANQPLSTRHMPLEEARASGAEALFGEKYEETVRVVSIDDFSRELCGGTHARRTGDLGLFTILSESGIAAGIRRIEAVTGLGAYRVHRERQALLEAACRPLRASPDQLPERVERLVAERKEQDHELEALRRKLARAEAGDIHRHVRHLGDVAVLAAEIPGDSSTLREEAERLRDNLGDRAVVVLGSRDDRSVKLAAMVSRSIAGDPIHAGHLLRRVARVVGGGGGGRPDMAQAGGRRPEALPEALEEVHTAVAELLDADAEAPGGS